MSFSVGLIIVSDRAKSGERDDKCLPVFEKHLPKDQYEIKERLLVSDDPNEINEAIKKLINLKFNLIFTSGGTGCGPRDNTPDVTGKLLDKPTSGLDEAIRAFSMKKTKNAAFSRALSGVADMSYIVNFPGSPKAVAQILEYILPFISHPLKLIAGKIKDCQQEQTNHKSDY